MMGIVSTKLRASAKGQEQAREIKFGDEPAPAIAARLGVTKEAIYAIRSGKNWGWLA